MVVVVAIVLILVAIGTPAVQSMWENQRRIDTLNIIQGMLTTTRAKAIQGREGELGLFFFVDGNNVQRIASLRRSTASRVRQRLEDNLYPVPPALTNPSLIPAYELALRDVFEVTDDRIYTVPTPTRIVPRYVVENEDNKPGSESWDLFSDDELANEVFETLLQGADNNQRHRNFFTIIFSGTGEVRPGRNVLILDFDSQHGNPPTGDVTGLRVGYDTAADTPNVVEYFRKDAVETTAPIDPINEWAIPFLVGNTDDPPTAVNFPSVDGLLVYDDSLLKDLDSPIDKRQALLRTGVPVYINRLTGAIVEGPVGETP